MNKKLFLILILTLTFLPLATATIGEGINNALDMIFGASGDLAYIKAGIWLVLFFVIFKSAERIFPANRGAAAIIALVVSMLGSRFMPDEYLESIGGGYAVLIGIILFLVPFFLGSMIGDLMRWSRVGKTFLIILFYIAFGYSLTRLGDIPFQGEASTVLDVVLTWASEHGTLVLIIIGAICVFFLFRTRSGGVLVPSGGGPSFFRGIGRGAGASSRWAMGWVARKRAAAKMRWAIREANRRRQARRGVPPFTTA